MLREPAGPALPLKAPLSDRRSLGDSSLQFHQLLTLIPTLPGPNLCTLERSLLRARDMGY